jgi:hypothetical protein
LQQTPTCGKMFHLAAAIKVMAEESKRGTWFRRFQIWRCSSRFYTNSINCLPN